MAARCSDRLALWQAGSWTCIGDSVSGWRWLFILEGIPAVIVGITTWLYMTDLPTQAGWLDPDERKWLVNELQSELQAKKALRNYTITGSILRFGAF
jgi:sugar phosphate permease